MPRKDTGSIFGEIEMNAEHLERKEKAERIAIEQRQLAKRFKKRSYRKSASPQLITWETANKWKSENRTPTNRVIVV